MPNSSPTTSDLNSIKARLRDFIELRDWNQFHSPKNLVMALVSEVGELVEEFQWLSEEQSRQLSEEKLRAVRDELADVQLYLIMLSEKIGVDILSAADEKITQNEKKYPAEKVRGSSKKYTEY